MHLLHEVARRLRLVGDGLPRLRHNRRVVQHEEPGLRIGAMCEHVVALTLVALVPCRPNYWHRPRPTRSHAGPPRRAGLDPAAAGFRFEDEYGALLDDDISAAIKSSEIELIAFRDI